MFPYDDLIHILNRLNVKDYRNVAYELINNDYQFFRTYFGPSPGEQQGGRQILVPDDNLWTKEFRYIQNDKTYTFVMTADEERDRTTYSVTGTRGSGCLVVFVARDSRIATLGTVSYADDCAKEGLRYPGGGTVLLRFILKFLKTHKRIMRIDRIVLKDNSLKYCAPGPAIHLPIMYTLLHGDTWYGKYGFRPYEPSSNTPDNWSIDRYQRNKAIIERVKVSEVPQLRQYIIDAFEKVNPSTLDLGKVLQWLDQFLDKDERLATFLQAFLYRERLYDETCILFREFYRQLADDINLYPFTGQSFYLDI